MLHGEYAFFYGGGRQPADYQQAEHKARDAKRGLWIFTNVSIHIIIEKLVKRWKNCYVS